MAGDGRRSTGPRSRDRAIVRGVRRGRVPGGGWPAAEEPNDRPGMPLCPPSPVSASATHTGGSHPMQGNRPLGVSTSLFRGILGPDAEPEGIRALQGTAISHIEYFCEDGARSHTNRQHLAAVKRAAADGGITVWSCHAPFGSTDISDPDESVRRNSVQRVIETMEAAAELSAGRVVLHGSREPIADEDREGRLERGARSLGELCRQAAQARSRLGPGASAPHVPGQPHGRDAEDPGPHGRRPASVLRREPHHTVRGRAGVPRRPRRPHRDSAHLRPRRGGRAPLDPGQGYCRLARLRGGP